MSQLLTEIWDGIKPFIPTKDRIHVADFLVSTLDDHGMTDGIEDEVGLLDKTLRMAVTSFYHLEDDVDIDPEE